MKQDLGRNSEILWLVYSTDPELLLLCDMVKKHVHVKKRDNTHN
jgi:hypothetical protein